MKSCSEGDTENDTSGPPHQKRARLFFSDDQKEMLRSAYTADPYPSQASIDELAEKLSVGSKTVTNWFHNHRMRGKNRYSTYSPSGSTPSPSVSHPGLSHRVGGVKSELN